MGNTKKKREKPTSSGSHRPPPRATTPQTSKDEGTQRPESSEHDLGMDERDIARRNAKPRSARESVKGSNDRKPARGRKSGRRSGKS